MKPNTLILGMPRSGTTWIAKIIDSHPDVIYFHEPDSVYPIEGLPLLLERSNRQSIDLVRKFCSKFPYINEKCLGKRPFFNKNGIHWLMNLISQNSILLSKIIKINTIYYPVNSFSKYGSQLCFKSIESVGRLGIFLESEPQLKVVFIIRSPFGQINSVLKGSHTGEFEHNNMTSLSRQELVTLHATYGHKFFELDTVFEFSSLQQLAFRWLVFNEKAIEEASVYSGRVHLINYDEFCETTLESSKKIFEFLELSVDQQSLEFISRSGDKHNTKYYSVSKDSSKTKDAWKHYFSSAQIEEINSVVGGTKSGQLFLNN